MARRSISTGNGALAEAVAGLRSFDAALDFFGRNEAQINSSFAIGLMLRALVGMAPATPAPLAAAALPPLARFVMLHGDYRSPALLDRLLRAVRPRDADVLAELLSLEDHDPQRAKHLLVRGLVVRYCFAERLCMDKAVPAARAVAHALNNAEAPLVPPYSVLLARLISVSPGVFGLREEAVRSLFGAPADAPRRLTTPLYLAQMQALEGLSRVWPRLAAEVQCFEAPPAKALSALGTAPLIRMVD